jgi:hypothetical protein
MVDQSSAGWTAGARVCPERPAKLGEAAMVVHLPKSITVAVQAAVPSRSRQQLCALQRSEGAQRRQRPSAQLVRRFLLLNADLHVECLGPCCITYIPTNLSLQRLKSRASSPLVEQFKHVESKPAARHWGAACEAPARPNKAFEHLAIPSQPVARASAGECSGAEGRDKPRAPPGAAPAVVAHS